MNQDTSNEPEDPCKADHTIGKDVNRNEIKTFSINDALRNGYYLMLINQHVVLPMLFLNIVVGAILFKMETIGDYSDENPFFYAGGTFFLVLLESLLVACVSFINWAFSTNVCDKSKTTMQILSYVFTRRIGDVLFTVLLLGLPGVLLLKYMIWKVSVIENLDGSNLFIASPTYFELLIIVVAPLITVAGAIFISSVIRGDSFIKTLHNIYNMNIFAVPWWKNGFVLTLLVFIPVIVRILTHYALPEYNPAYATIFGNFSATRRLYWRIFYTYAAIYPSILFVPLGLFTWACGLSDTSIKKIDAKDGNDKYKLRYYAILWMIFIGLGVFISQVARATHYRVP